MKTFPYIISVFKAIAQMTGYLPFTNEKGTIGYIEKNIPNLFQQDISELQKRLIDFFERIFSIEEKICGSDYLDEKTVQRIGVNSNMCICKNTYYTYAACHHCYSKVKNVPSKYIVHSPCYRTEMKQNKYRRTKFHMLEVVEFDKEEILERQRLIYIYIMTRILELHGVSDVRAIIANDSFITDSKEKIVYQMLNKSKVEIQAFSTSLGEYVAITSINMHYKYFVQKFGITCSAEYNSMCFGIGLERLMEMIAEEEQ